MRLAQNHKILGVVFLVLLLLGVWFTYAIFTKKFADYEEVTLQSSKLGLQLPERADVKIRGVLVGEVLDFQPTAEGAEITLGIYPDQLDTIPANVTGSILPKTLFGEKYVSLVVPDSPAQEHITSAVTISQTRISTEVEQVLSDLYPLLRTIQPAELNMTLNALSTALEGRGEQLGGNIETLDSYLRRINPQIPQLVEDLRLTAEVSDTYSEILPEVAQILDDTRVTTGTFEEREERINALFTDVSAFSDTARSFLAENGDNIVRLGEISAEQLSVLARYSPMFPCLTAGIVKAGKLEAEAFRNFMLHIVLETIPRQPRPYTPRDVPRVGEDRGPNCGHLPNPPWNQANPVRKQPNFNDGVDEPTGKGTMRVAPGYAGTPADVGVLKEYLRAGGSQGSDLEALLTGPFLGEVR